jgi:hypothetical protein
MQSELFEKKQRKQRVPAENIYNDFLWYFKMEWEKIYRNREFVVTGKQYGQAKHLLRPVPGFPAITGDEAFRRVDRFLANPHFKVCSHAFHKLLEHWDMFTATIAAENKPVRSTAHVEDIELIHTCTQCRIVLKQKRSVWLQHKNKTGRCKCGSTFSVNDILKKISTIQDYLPRQGQL